MNAHHKRYAKAFEEWHRQYREEPETFMSEAVLLLKHTPKSYGELCAAFFASLLADMKPKRKTRKK